MSGLERALTRDRLVVSTALAALTAGCWVQMALGDSASAPGKLMPCCGARFSVTFSMWVVMMAGMMTPSAAPMVVAHASIVRRRQAQAPWLASASFLGGYLLAWSGFSAVAAVAQWALFRGKLLDVRSLSVAPWAGCAVLLLAGAFQLSELKATCLKQCRAPLGYFLTEWREGPLGAVAMGLRHGLYCIGCCWMLMAVLFAVGTMNVIWGATITAFVIAEKVLPWPRAVVLSGAGACVFGAVALAYRAVLGV